MAFFGIDSRILALFLACLFALGNGGCKRKSSSGGDAKDFDKLSQAGKNYYDNNQLDKAIQTFQEALRIQPTHPDAHLNLANAYLLANQPEKAFEQAQQALKIDRNLAAGHYLSGCSLLRQGKPQEAVKWLQQAKDIDRTINAVTFQLGLAHQQLGQHEEAVRDFEEVVQYEPDHSSAHYNLSQSLIRLGRTDEANAALAQHQKVNAGKPAKITNPAEFERCVYTHIRAPFQLEMPDPEGIKVVYTDGTAQWLGAAASSSRGPIGILDFGHQGRLALFLTQSNAFRALLWNSNTFAPFGEPLPARSNAVYSRCLVADFNNDQAEDALVVGPGGTHLFQFTTNGVGMDATMLANLQNVSLSDAFLIDLQFSPNLSFLGIVPETKRLRYLRNLGGTPAPYFMDGTTNAGVPINLANAVQFAADDWNGDDLVDLVIARDSGPPLLLTRVRGGTLTDTNQPAGWPASRVVALGDINNDLRPDLATFADGNVVLIQNGVADALRLSAGQNAITGIQLVDYDNDGWLDIFATGSALSAWRNLGHGKFADVTSAIGLNSVGAVASLRAVDLDGDCDLDLALTHPDQTVVLLRNDGGNSNRQIKLHLVGTRSNSSGIGTRVELNAGGLRVARRVMELPVAIGVGKHNQIDALMTRWLSLNPTTLDLKLEDCSVIPITELSIQDTSCPYLYTWDGKRFRFVSDFLGASPVGLPAAANRYIDADIDEFLYLGNEANVQPRDGDYILQVSEELREVLYLDEARFVVVDHPPGSETHPTDKLLPRKPFPPSELVTVHRRIDLRKAEQLDGKDITASLQGIDNDLVSPPKRRVSQLRGHAELHGLVLDFGPLGADRPLVLALTGWLRFGGATANMAASTYPGLAFPFPLLQAEVRGSDNVMKWQAVDVSVGAPAGKTKTILVDLTGKLPPGAGRLRMTMGFELHWDRIALFEKAAEADTKITDFKPQSADLHWRGFGRLEELPWNRPQTPIYDQVEPNAPWSVIPGGWCTRYGSVTELVTTRDEALLVLNAGDELTLRIPAASLPPKPEGYTRSFFFYSVGWDKDADFHTRLGNQVEPLPWSTMDDQRYGETPRPAFSSDLLMQKYNTRWVGSHAFRRRN